MNKSKQIYIDPDLHSEIKILAAQQGIQIKTLMERLWLEYKQKLDSELNEDTVHMNSVTGRKK